MGQELEAAEEQVVENGRTRVAKVFYRHFRVSAARALDAACRRLHNAAQAREEASKTYPELAALTDSQVKNLLRVHRCGGSRESQAVDCAGEDPELVEARCVLSLRRARAELDDEAFARVLDFGMYLIDKGGR